MQYISDEEEEKFMEQLEAANEEEIKEKEEGEAAKP